MHTISFSTYVAWAPFFHVPDHVPHLYCVRACASDLFHVLNVPKKCILSCTVCFVFSCFCQSRTTPPPCKRESKKSGLILSIRFTTAPSLNIFHSDGVSASWYQILLQMASKSTWIVAVMDLMSNPKVKLVEVFTTYTPYWRFGLCWRNNICNTGRIVLRSKSDFRNFFVWVLTSSRSSKCPPRCQEKNSFVTSRYKARLSNGVPLSCAIVTAAADLFSHILP